MLSLIFNNVEPFIYVGFYLIICGILKLYQPYLKKLYQENINYKKYIKNISIVHNIGLILFSFSVTVILSIKFYILFGTIYPKEILKYLIFDDQTLINVCWLFTYSKVWEFLDTFLIMLKGHDTIFLQKYHHAGAIIFWYLCTKYQTSGILFPTLFNAFVHTIMYLYYLLCLYGYKLNKYKPYITGLQLFQLLTGNITGIVYYVIPNYHIKSEQLYSCIGIIIYVFILIWLFIDFSIRSYITKNK